MGVELINTSLDRLRIYSRPVVGMPDVQNFFHEALAVIISKLQYIYQKKALGELYLVLPLSSCAHFHFFLYKFQLNENAKALCLYCTDSKGKIFA